MAITTVRNWEGSKIIKRYYFIRTTRHLGRDNGSTDNLMGAFAYLAVETKHYPEFGARIHVDLLIIALKELPPASGT